MSTDPRNASSPYARHGLPVGYGIATGVVGLLRGVALALGRLAVVMAALLLLAGLIDGVIG